MLNLKTSLNIMFALAITLSNSVIANPVTAENGSEFQTIYLVRHAEKITGAGKNPNLTECGIKRSAALAEFFEFIELDNIFSTNYNRTLSTTKPTTLLKQQPLELYDPRNLVDFANKLTKLNGNILVVGHSNTTPVLAGLLAGIELKSFDESIYDRIYQVTIIDGKSHLQILKQGFQCK